MGLRNLATFHILIRSHQLKKTDACCQIPNSTGKTVEFLLIIPKQIMRLVEFSEGLVNYKSTGIQICLRVRSIWFLVTFVTFTNFSVAMSSWIRKCSRNTLVFICFDSKFWGCSGILFGQGARVNLMDKDSEKLISHFFQTMWCNSFMHLGNAGHLGLAAADEHLIVQASKVPYVIKLTFGSIYKHVQEALWYCLPWFVSQFSFQKTSF